MFVNLIVLLTVIALAVFFGWLTRRAVKAQRMWVKILGGLGAGLLTLVLAAIAFFSSKGIAAVLSPGAPPAPELKVEGTPEQIARGEYLVNVACIGCHGAVDAEGNPTGQMPLTGGYNISQAEGFGFVGDMVAENLTPGDELGNYSDGELFRAIRYRVDKDGRLITFMSFLSYNQLSDEDTQAIIAYLRTLPPTEQIAQTGDKLSFLGTVMFGAGMFGTSEKGAASVTAPPQGVTAEYGKYVATFGDCRGCHGPDMTGVPESPAGPAVPNPRPLVSSLTQEQFIEMMRSGIRPGNHPFPDTMPWQSAAKMTDDDLSALYLYLTTAP